MNYSLPQQEGIKSVRCVCVCLSVSQHSIDWTIWATDLKSDMGIDLDNISDEVEGQGNRSKFKVAMLKNFLWCDLCRMHRAILSWHPLTTFRQENWQWGHVAGGRVNAQAFSLSTLLVQFTVQRDRKRCIWAHRAVALKNPSFGIPSYQKEGSFFRMTSTLEFNSAGFKDYNLKLVSYIW